MSKYKLKIPEDFCYTVDFSQIDRIEVTDGDVFEVIHDGEDKYGECNVRRIQNKHVAKATQKLNGDREV